MRLVALDIGKVSMLQCYVWGLGVTSSWVGSCVESLEIVGEQNAHAFLLQFCRRYLFAEAQKVTLKQFFIVTRGVIPRMPLLVSSGKPVVV